MDPAEASAFTDTALAAADVAFYLMKHVAESSACLETASRQALAAGDRRTLTLLRFVRGCALFFSGKVSFDRTLAAMNEAMDLLEILDDEELSARAMPFLILIHFVRGNFRQVVLWYEQLQKNVYKPVLPFMDSQLVLQASSSAAYLGHFAHAAGMIRSAISTAELNGQIMGAQLCRQHMGILLAYMRREAEAREALEGVIAQSTMTANPKLMLRAFAALALCHAQSGEAEASYKVFSHALGLAKRNIGFSLSYNYLWILELAILYDLHGFAPLPGIDADDLLEKSRHSPSPMMRGHALRCEAARMLQRGRAPREALALLDESLVCLEEARTPLERAFTQEQRGRALRRLGDEERAREAEMEAARLFGELGIGRQIAALPADAGFPLLERCSSEIAAILDWETPGAFGYQLAACLRRLLRGERSAIFRWEGEGLACLGSCNISASEIFAEGFAPNRELIAARLVEEEPFAAVRNGLDTVCIPVRAGEGVPCLLYVDSEATASRLRRVAPEDLRAIGFLFGAELRNVLRLAELSRLKAEASRIQAVNDLTEEGRLEVWGRSAAFRHCLERARVVAATDAPVLLLGETGVGKEVMANFIHRNGGGKGPFVAVHPASVSETLFENEFFGHEKGAFTGAVTRKIGLFELADNGTLFIDEVGDVPMNMQIKLLRVLQEHTFMRVGGTKEIRSSFRLIAATNRDLAQAVREGSFREDLYYRISVVPLTIPPLRGRLEDIEEIVTAFIDYFSRRYGKRVPLPDEAAFARLRAYAWPGNLRELRNVVERAVILHSGGPLALIPAAAPARGGTKAEEDASLYADTPTLEVLQRRYIEHVLKKTGGRVCGPEGAEGILGMKRSTLYLKLRQYGISTRDSRT